MALDATVTPEEAYKAILDACRFADNKVNEAIITFSVDTTADKVFALRVLKKAFDTLSDYENVAGLDEFVQILKGDANYFITTDITAIKTALVAMITWVNTNYPSDPVTGRLDDRTYNFLTGEEVFVTFPATASAPLVLLLQDIDNLISFV